MWNERLSPNVKPHDGVIKWQHLPRYWPFVRGIHRSQRPVTRSFDIFVDLRLNERLGKQSWGWWFETPSRTLWRHSNVTQNSQHDNLTDHGTTVNVSSVEEDDELIIVTCSLALVNYLSSYLMTAIHCSWPFSGPFYWHGLTLIPAWITNCIHDKVWDEITHPFLKFNGATVEV